MSEASTQPDDLSDILPRIPSIPASELAASDSSASAVQARSEDASLTRNASTEELECDAREREHNRDQAFKQHFERIAIGALWFGAASLFFIGGVWGWHMIAPEQWRWLSTEEVSHLQSLMTAGILASVAGKHFKRRIG